MSLLLFPFLSFCFSLCRNNRHCFLPEILFCTTAARQAPVGLFLHWRGKCQDTIASGEATSISSCWNDASSGILYHTTRRWSRLITDWKRSIKLWIKLAFYCKETSITSYYIKSATKHWRQKNVAGKIFHKHVSSKQLIKWEGNVIDRQHQECERFIY